MIILLITEKCELMKCRNFIRSKPHVDGPRKFLTVIPKLGIV